MPRHLAAVSLVVLALLIAAGPAFAQTGDNELFSKLGVTRGICVVLGDRDAAVARQLAKSTELTIFVQLASQADADAAARAADQAGLYGKRIFVSKGQPERIGLADNLADAVVILEAGKATPKAEVLRVLRPEGRAIAAQEKMWTKPVPPGMDDWSHHYHGPDNNPQSRDRLARAPLLTQFMADPRFAPGPQQVVASAGRVFAAFGHVAWHQREEAMMDTLVAVNAYNGTILWRRPVTPGIMLDRSTMIATPTTLYVADDKLCKLIDPATGRVKDEIMAPENLTGGTFWKWIALDAGVLYALVGEQEPLDPDARWRNTSHGWPWTGISKGYNDVKQQWGQGKTLLAINPQTKQVLWHYHEDVPIDSRSLCLSGGRAFFCSFGRYITCLNTANGNVLWRRTAEKDADLLKQIGPYRTGQGWVEGWKTQAYAKCTERAYYFVGPQVEWITALAAEDGRFLWKHPVKNAQAVIRDDGLYLIGAQFSKTDTKKLDPLTGAELAAYRTNRRACTRSTGTADGIFFRSEEGSGRFDVAGGFTQWITPMRPSCHVGVVVAAGHMYWMPWACDCNLQMTGLIGCGPAGDFDFYQKADERRLEKGAAAADRTTPPGDWPTYRADNARSGHAAATVPERVSLRWDQPGKPGVELTAPVIANSLAMVGGSDGIVRAFDAAGGKEKWRAYTGGAVRYPPAVADGRALVGSGDGWVYALDASTGRVVWRFRAAPADRRIPFYGSLLSTWPVAGGMLVEKGVAYCAAGINDYDGTHVYALDAATGRVRWENHTAGHIDAQSKRGVACQGELLLSGDRLYLAGGSAASPGVFDIADGRCLTPPPTSHGAAAPRGRELTLVKGKVAVSGPTLYMRPDLPFYDGALKWQPAVVAAKNANLVCMQRPGKNGPGWHLVAQEPSDTKELWAVPLSAEPVRWGIAVDGQGRIVVALRNGHIACYGTANL